MNALRTPQLGLAYFTAPEPKQAFRNGPAGVPRLFSEPIQAGDSLYWEHFWRLPDSQADLPILLDPLDLRKIVADQPANLSTLVSVLVRQLSQLVRDPFLHHDLAQQDRLARQTPAPLAAAAAVGGWLASIYQPPRLGMASVADEPARNRVKELLNCIRALTYLVPFLFEPAHAAFERDILMAPLSRTFTHPSSSVTPQSMQEDPQFVLQDDHDEEEEQEQTKVKQDSQPETVHDPLKPISSRQNPEKDHTTDKESTTTLGDHLVDLSLILLFLPGFTVPFDREELPPAKATEAQVGSDLEGTRAGSSVKTNPVIWSPGVGSTTTDVSNLSTYLQHRAEVLRLCLSLLSKPLYAKGSSLAAIENPYLQRYQSIPERRFHLTLICSLLNSSLAQDQSLLARVKSTPIPYSHLIANAVAVSNPVQVLAQLCSQTILILLGSSEPTNPFVTSLSKIHRPTDVDFLVEELIHILRNEMQRGFTAGAKGTSSFAPECLMLFAKLLTSNKHFQELVISTKAIEVFSILLAFCLDHKNDNGHQGMIRLSIYVLQTLSSDKHVARLLNHPIPASMANRWATFTRIPQPIGSDMLIHTIYCLIAGTANNLEFLHANMITILANTSPYLVNISPSSSAKIFLLFNSFISPRYLVANQGRPRMLYLLLEALSNILKEQVEHNPNIVYGILRCHASFQDLSSERFVTQLTDFPSRSSQLDLSDASSATASAYEAQSPQTPRFSRSSSQSSALNGLKGMASPSEKAKGKMRESSSDSQEPMAVATPLKATSKFTPNRDWITSWHDKLPLEAVNHVITELLPAAQECLKRNTSALSPDAMLSIIKDSKIRAILADIQEAVAIRPFAWDNVRVWLTTLLLGYIYMTGELHGVWRGTHIQLLSLSKPNKPALSLQSVTQVIGEITSPSTPTTPSSNIANA